MTLEITDKSVLRNRNLCCGRLAVALAIGSGMKTLADRVRERRLELGLTQAQLAEKVGMKQQGIRSIEAGESKRPRKLRELARALETTETFLLGDWYLDPEDAPPPFEPKDFMPSRLLPVIGDVAAGLWLETGAMPEEPQEWLPFVPVLGGNERGIYALRIRGNSVDKIAPDGSYLVCIDIGESGAEVEDNDLVVVERRRIQEQVREVTVKRVKRTRTGIDLIPESTDPRWKPVKFTKADENDDLEIRVIAHVKWIAKKPT
jgi:SOS-response transcriptional repressor LexA